MLLTEVIGGAARRRPDHIGLVSPEGEFSYAELAARVTRLAAGLTRYTEPGDRVAILADNCVEYLDCLYGCSLAGTTLTLVNQRLTRPEIEFVLADAEPSVLIVGAEHLGRVADVRTAVPSIRTVVVIGSEASDGVLGYDDLLAAGTGVDPASRAHRDAADTAWLIYTSGTTGRPKGAMLSHRAIVSASLNAMLEWRLTPEDRNLFCFPLCHVAAFIPVVYHLRATTVVLMRGFDPATWLDLVAAHRITHAGLAPTMLDLILRTPGADTADLDSIDLVVYGGSPMPPPLLEAGITRFGDVFMGSYGMTELSGNVLMLGIDEHRRAVAGEPGLLQAAGRCECLAAVRVVDPGVDPADDGELRDVAVGEVGEIVVRGDQVMTGYWRAEEATREVLVDGWLRTGDLARVDAEGLFYIVDRKKDMIITGAENVYPREVEVVLSRCPGVADVAVVGLPDERWGEAVTAVVVPEPGTVLDADRVREFCRTSLAGYKVPKRVETVDVLPRNAAGKVLKRQLRERY